MMKMKRTKRSKRMSVWMMTVMTCCMLLTCSYVSSNTDIAPLSEVDIECDWVN